MSKILGFMPNSYKTNEHSKLKFQEDRLKNLVKQTSKTGKQLCQLNFHSENLRPEKRANINGNSETVEAEIKNYLGNGAGEDFQDAVDATKDTYNMHIQSYSYELKWLKSIEVDKGGEEEGKVTLSLSDFGILVDRDGEFRIANGKAFSEKIAEDKVAAANFFNKLSENRRDVQEKMITCFKYTREKKQKEFDKLEEKAQKVSDSVEKERLTKQQEFMQTMMREMQMMMMQTMQMQQQNQLMANVVC
jgi:hypothetical protein